MGKKRIFLLLLSLFLVFPLFHCVSTEKRFEKGKELESRGRYEEAARYYIKVLEKDPTWEESRQRLENVGARAVDSFLKQAQTFKSTQSYEDTVQVLNRLDDLRQRSEKVGVIFLVPDDYENFRQEMISAAISSLFKEGEYAEQAGDWAEAISKYEHLKNLYPLTPAQRERADLAVARVYVSWAEQDLAGRFYRAAFDHAQKAIETLGPESISGLNALNIQKAALEAGTRIVAVLPLWSSERVEREVPEGMARELYDVLLYEYLSKPVPFVAVADPGKVHREMRRLDLKDKQITLNVAVKIGQNLITDFVAVGKLEFYLREEKVLQEIEHKVRLRTDPSSSSAFVEQKYSIKIMAELKLQLIDPVIRRVVDEETVHSEVKDQFRRGVYDGDSANLELSRSEHRLFDREALQQAEQELVDKLIDQLAERLAERINGRVLRFVR